MGIFIGVVLMAILAYNIIDVIIKSNRAIDDHQQGYHQWRGQQGWYQQPILLPTQAESRKGKKNIVSQLVDAYQQEALLTKEQTLKRGRDIPPAEPDNEVFPDGKEEEQEPEPREERDLSTVPLDELEAINPQEYYDAIAVIRWIVTEHYCMLLARKDGPAKIIRDSNKSGYIGLVAPASASEQEKSQKISREEWDHTCRVGGIFWDANVLEKDEEGNVILSPNEKENLENWFRSKGYKIRENKE
jgi:hypothetical protein